MCLLYTYLSLLALQQHGGEVNMIYPLQWIGRNASNDMFFADLFKEVTSLISTIPYQMPTEIGKLRSVTGHQVAGHKHGSLVVHVYAHG